MIEFINYLIMYTVAAVWIGIAAMVTQMAVRSIKWMFDEFKSKR